MVTYIKIKNCSIRYDECKQIHICASEQCVQVFPSIIVLKA